MEPHNQVMNPETYHYYYRNNIQGSLSYQYENSQSNHYSSSNDSDERPTTSTARTMRNVMIQEQEQEHNHSEGLNLRLNVNSHGLYQLLGQMQVRIEEDKGLPREYIDKIKKMKMGRSGRDCSVCYNGFQQGEKIRKLPCDHIFHEDCIMPWLEKNITCPNCRLNLIEFFNENLEY